MLALESVSQFTIASLQAHSQMDDAEQVMLVTQKILRNS